MVAMAVMALLSVEPGRRASVAQVLRVIRGSLSAGPPANPRPPTNSKSTPREPEPTPTNAPARSDLATGPRPATPSPKPSKMIKATRRLQAIAKQRDPMSLDL